MILLVPNGGDERVVSPAPTAPEAASGPVLAVLTGIALFVVGVLLAVHGWARARLAWWLSTDGLGEALLGALVAVLGITVGLRFRRGFLAALHGSARLRGMMIAAVVGLPAMTLLWLMIPVGGLAAVGASTLLPDQAKLEAATGLGLTDEQFTGWDPGPNEAAWSVVGVSDFPPDVLFEVRRYPTAAIATLVDLFRWVRDPLVAGHYDDSFPLPTPDELREGALTARRPEVRCVGGTGIGCAGIVGWARYGQYLVRFQLSDFRAGAEIGLYPIVFVAWHHHIGEMLGLPG